jgi:hypothetical protein
MLVPNSDVLCLSVLCRSDFLCVCGSTLRILLEFLLPKDGSLVAFGTYALQYGKAIAGLPTCMEVTPRGNSCGILIRKHASKVSSRGIWVGVELTGKPHSDLARQGNPA